MDKGNKKNLGLELALERAGGQAALGRLIGRSQASVWEWAAKTGKVSAEDAVAIEEATGVPAETISPAIRRYAKLRKLRMRRAA